MEAKYFGEGLTVWNDRIYQLTWHEKTGFVYDRDSLSLIRTFKHSFEGWGLTHNSEHLIASDGSDQIYFLSPNDDFAVVKTIRVREAQPNGRSPAPVNRINEMEWCEGLIYANLWYSDRIALIDPNTGFVMHYLTVPDALFPAPPPPPPGTPRSQRRRPVDLVANGIAFDSVTKRLWITGKWWDKLYQIEYTPAAELIAAAQAAAAAQAQAAPTDRGKG